MPLSIAKPAAKPATVASGADKYKKLLEKVQSLNLGGTGFLKVPEGRTTLRILPPVGTMQYFFKEVGTHYLGQENGSGYKCLAICTDGQQTCPLCQIGDDLYKNGEKEASKTFYASRSFYMNVIDRAAPDRVQIWSAGVTAFQGLTTLVSDPDYGDISDPGNGFDIKLDRKGTGKTDTRYQLQGARNPTAAGTAEQVEEWLGAAQDLEEMIAKQLLSPEELINKAGVGSYFGMGDEEPTKAPAKSSAKAKAEPEPWDEGDDDEEETPAPASKAIAAKMEQRAGRAQLLRRGK